MSINKLVSVNNVIVNLLDSLSLDHTKHKPMFVRWILDAEKQIGSYYQNIRKIEVITIKGCVAELPDDAKVLELALLGDYGCDCGDLFTKFCGSALNAQVTTGNINSTSFLVVDLPSSATSENGYIGWGMVNYVVSNNKIILDRNYDGQKLTIQYLGMSIDCNGIPEVGENHLIALEEYCLWQYKRRNVRSGIDIGVNRDHERLWNQYCASARADDAQPSAAEQELAAKMINNPFSGRGLKLTPINGYRYGYNY
jgi:hypothetical protein